jgi:hypothetical protein
MLTQQGYEIVAGRMVPTDWLPSSSTPSFPHRLVHMSVATFLATALLRLIRKGPVIGEGATPETGGPGHPHTPARPLSAARKSDRDDAANVPATEGN